MSLRIPQEEMKSTIEKAMLKAGVPAEKGAVERIGGHLGSSMSLALDLAGTLIGNGRRHHEILKKTEDRVAAANAAHPIDPARPVRWPGEGTAQRRAESQKLGIKANEKVWAEVCRLAE